MHVHRPFLLEGCRSPTGNALHWNTYSIAAVIAPTSQCFLLQFDRCNSMLPEPVGKPPWHYLMFVVFGRLMTEHHHLRKPLNEDTFVPKYFSL